MALTNAFGALATESKVEEVRSILDSVSNVAPGFEKVTVGTVSGRIAANFTGPTMPQDGFSVVSTGTGQSVTLGGAANGARYMAVTSGTTASAQTIVQSDDLVTLPVRLNAQVSASQRIANQFCYLELAGVDEAGVVEEDATGPLNWLAIRWDGTTAANAVIQTRCNGGSVATSAAAAFGTTAATGTGPNFLPAVTFDVLAYAERIMACGYAVDSLAAGAGTIARTTALPNPLKEYRVRFRVLNGASAPASTTDWRLHQTRIIDQTRLTAEITGGVGRAGDAQSSVPVTGSVVVSGTVTSSTTVTANQPTPTASTVNSAATTNATVVKGAAGTLYSITASNTNAAARFVKVYNKATAPTAGTDVPVLTIPVPPGAVVTIPFGTNGMRLGTGIGLAITAGAADSDTAAVAVAEVKVVSSFI